MVRNVSSGLTASVCAVVKVVSSELTTSVSERTVYFEIYVRTVIDEISGNGQLIGPLPGNG